MATRWYYFTMKIDRPGTVLWIYFGIGFLLYTVGIRDGVLLLIALIAGIFLYKMTAQR